MSSCFEALKVISPRPARTAPLFRLSLGCLSFSLCLALAAVTPPARADSPITRWTLAKIDVVSKLRPEAQVVAESYGAQGGDVEIVTHGEARYNNDPPVCPGGQERIHFHWEFPQDVTHINGGEKRAVVVTAKTLEVVKPCWGGFSDNSGIDVLGDNSWPYDVERQQIDVDRVWTDGTNSASSKGDGGTASPGVEFGNWPAKEGMPFAYFYVQLHTYLSLPIYYVYMYKNNVGGTDAAAGAMPGATGPTNAAAADPATEALSGTTPAVGKQPAPGATPPISAEPPTPQSEALMAALEHDPSIEEIANEAPAIVLLVQIEVAQGKIAAGDAPAAVDAQAAAYRRQHAKSLWRDLDHAGTDYLKSLSLRAAAVTTAGTSGRVAPDTLTALVNLQLAKAQFAADIGQGQAPVRALALADHAVAEQQGSPDPKHFAMQRDLLQRALAQLLDRPAPAPPNG